MSAVTLCPACRSRLASERASKCRCGWHLLTLEEWLALDPFPQGFALYMQSSWPSSELRDQKNPYDEGTLPWRKFREGEHAATLSAMDGEE